MLTDEHEPIPDCDCKRCAITERARLRAELAKVTWQRNEARADLAASRAESERPA